MRVLLVTWDGAGNLPPALALISGLVERGHKVVVLGHDSQEKAIRQAGGDFHRFLTAPQLDQGKQIPYPFDFIAWFMDFTEKALPDILAETQQIDPHLMLLDCMLPPALTSAKATGRKVAALVHGAFSAHAAWTGPIADADLALSCSYPEFDEGTEPPANMVFVGPLRPLVNGRGWTRKSPQLPLVVASLSSALQGPPNFQHDLLQRVCDALSTLPVEALITTGRGIDPESLSAAPNTSVERSVDHSLTLPQASLFITHCGHGSIMAALRAGVPMLCLPPLADQPHNAALVARLGLGETLDPLSSSQTIAAAITRLLANTQMSAAAKQFAEVAAFEPRREHALDLLEALAR